MDTQRFIGANFIDTVHRQSKFIRKFFDHADSALVDPDLSVDEVVERAVWDPAFFRNAVNRALSFSQVFFHVPTIPLERYRCQD